MPSSSLIDVRACPASCAGMPPAFGAAHAAGFVPVASKRDTMRGWSWLFQYRLFHALPVQSVSHLSKTRLSLGDAVDRCTTCTSALRPRSHAGTGKSCSVRFRQIRTKSTADSNRCAARFADGHRVVTAQHLAVHLAQIQMLLRSARNIAVRTAVANEGFLRLNQSCR